MANPNEVFEDLTAQATDTNTTFTVSKTPYVAGTVSVWRNGLLQDPDFFVETDPTNGVIDVCEPILVREEEDHGIIVSYCTFEDVFVDPEAPVHISKLTPGNVVRIAMKAGRHLEPVFFHKNKQTKLLPGRSPSGKSLRAKNYSRTVFLGFITNNDSVGGKLTLQVEDRHGNPGCRVHMEACVPYRDILVIRKFITPGRRSDVGDVPIGGGPRAARRPGVVAKGFFDTKGFLNLVKVFFYCT